MPAPPAPSGFGTVYFYRLGAFPKLRTPAVSIDAIKVYDPPEEAYTWVYVKEGARDFRVEWAWDTKWPKVEFNDWIIAGQSYFYKISGSFENKGVTGYNEVTHVLGSSTQRIPYERALTELQGCCRYLPPDVHEIPKP